MEKISATKVTQYLDISYNTLNSWYRWYNNPMYPKPKDMPKLPEFIQDTPRGPRYWTEDDLYDLRKFKEWIPKGRNGVMGDYNARYWGERGKRAIKNKQEKQNTL